MVRRHHINDYPPEKGPRAGTIMTKLVYAFTEGDGKNKQLLGGKGANRHYDRGLP